MKIRLLTALALAGLVAMPALADKVPAHGTLIVHDDAGAFSESGVTAAKAAFEGIDFKHRTTMVVKTAKDVPAARKADFDAVKGDKAKFHQFMKDWAEELMRAEGSRTDVYALVLVNDKNSFQIHMHSNRQSSVYGTFNDAKADQAAGKLATGFETVRKNNTRGDDAKRDRDASLLASVNFVADVMKDVTVPERGNRGNQAVNHSSTTNSGGSSIMSYICIGLVVLMGVWLVIGLIRALTGGGGGGGMGGGGMMGGGGGGGFMSSMLGGMFGSMAGMYMYDNFFGGHSHSNDMGASGSNYGNDGGGNYDTGADDYSGGASGNAGGGDWGDSGGDNAGGGDWGGGGDAGGGDFGGGDW